MHMHSCIHSQRSHTTHYACHPLAPQSSDPLCAPEQRGAKGRASQQLSVVARVAGSYLATREALRYDDKKTSYLLQQSKGLKLGGETF